MKKFLILLSALLLSFQVQAALISGPDIIAAVSVQEDSPTNSAQQAFNEQQGVTLAGNLVIDGGFITAGTRVDSHLIFLNTTGGRNDPSVTDRATWGFDGVILGVMSDIDGVAMGNSNLELAAFGNYFADVGGLPFNNAGMEGADFYNILLGTTIDVNMLVTEPGDWIRVITASAVPVPAAAFLFAPALLGFVGLRRKAKLAVK